MFEKAHWIQVKAQDSIWADSVLIEKTPGKKTYTIHYTNGYTNNDSHKYKREGVRESYIMDLVNNINRKCIK